MLDDLKFLRLTSESTSTGASKSMYGGVYGDGAVTRDSRSTHFGGISLL